MSGKGSKPRPLSVPRKKFEDNWERIFSGGKNKKPNRRRNREGEALSDGSRRKASPSPSPE